MTPTWIVLCGLCAGCGRLGFEARLGDIDDPDGPGATTPPPVVTEDGALAFTATIAECLDPSSPDLTSCTSINGAGQLVVDGNDGTTGSPWQSYLRFDLGNALDGLTVTRVTLVMTATSDGKAEGPDSGDVWQVERFDRASLATTVPALLRADPLAKSLGSVDPLDVLEWELPVAMAGSSSVHLGVITADDKGGVNYWNLRGEAPPQLVFDVE